MGKTYRKGGGDDDYYAFERMKRENEKRAKKKNKRSYDSVDRDESYDFNPDKKWR